MKVGSHHHYDEAPPGDMTLMESVYPDEGFVIGHSVEVDQYTENSLQPADIVVSQQPCNAYSPHCAEAQLIADPAAGSSLSALSNMMSLNLQPGAAHRGAQSAVNQCASMQSMPPSSTIGSEIELARRLGVRFDSSNAAWVARWVDPHSEKKKSRWFSVAKYGELSARRLAIQACLQNMKASDFSNFRDLQDVLASLTANPLIGASCPGLGALMPNDPNQQAMFSSSGLPLELMMLDGSTSSVNNQSSMVPSFFHNPFNVPPNYYALAAMASGHPPNSPSSMFPQTSSNTNASDTSLLVCQGVPQDQVVVGMCVNDEDSESACEDKVKTEKQEDESLSKVYVEANQESSMPNINLQNNMSSIPKSEAAAQSHEQSAYTMMAHQTGEENTTTSQNNEYNGNQPGNFVGHQEMYQELPNMWSGSGMMVPMESYPPLQVCSMDGSQNIYMPQLFNFPGPSASDQSFTGDRAATYGVYASASNNSESNNGPQATENPYITYGAYPPEYENYAFLKHSYESQLNDPNQPANISGSCNIPEETYYPTEQNHNDVSNNAHDSVSDTNTSAKYHHLYASNDHLVPKPPCQAFSSLSSSDVDRHSDLDEDDNHHHGNASSRNFFVANKTDSAEADHLAKKRKVDFSMNQSMATTACETTDQSQTTSSSPDPSNESSEQLMLASCANANHNKNSTSIDNSQKANTSTASVIDESSTQMSMNYDSSASLLSHMPSYMYVPSDADVDGDSQNADPNAFHPLSYYSQFMNYPSSQQPGANYSMAPPGNSNYAIPPMMHPSQIQQAGLIPPQHLDLALGQFYLANPYQFPGLMGFSGTSDDSPYIQADDLYNDATGHHGSQYKRLGVGGVTGGLNCSGGSYGTHHGLSAKMTCERGLHYSKNYRGNQECWIAVWNTKGGRIMHEAFDVTIMGFEQAKSKAREARDAAHSNNLAVAENSRPSWKSHSNTGIPHVSLDSQQLRFRAHKFGRRLCRSFSFGRRRGSFASRESAFDAAVLWLIQTPTEEEIAAVSGVSSKMEEPL